MGRRLEKYLLLLVFEVLYEICLICTGTYEEIYENSGVDFGEATERNVSGPLGFLSSNTHLATSNPKFLTEIEPECGEDFFGLQNSEIRLKCGDFFFFCLHLNLEPKFLAEIELFSLTKLRKNILPPRNLLNKKLTPMYENIPQKRGVNLSSL